MTLINTSSYNPDITNAVSGEQQIFNQIKSHGTKKDQLKKVAQEFESLFITKMFTLMDKTVDKEGGIFGEETKYLDNFKSYTFNELGRQLSQNPRTSFGFAKAIYTQMEKYVTE